MSPSGTYLMGGNCEFSCWTPETQYQAKILEMDAEGNILWRRLYGGPQDDYFTSICALSFGGIVGIGYLYGGWSSVLHVGANGDSVNTFMVPEPVDPAYVREINQGDYVFGGRVYVDGLYRVGLLNMHEDGNLVWERQYGTEVHHLPWTFDTTSDGGYVITGRTGDYPGDSVFVLRTTASGDSLWYTTLGDVDSFYVLAAHQTPDGGYIFCGGSGEWPRDFKLVKLTPELGVAAPPSSPASFTLLQNYPNPFNAATEIRYELTSASHVTLRVSDLLGREVAVLVNQNMSPGSYAVSFDAADLPSGIYLYSLAAGLHHATRKMILLR